MKSRARHSHVCGYCQLPGHHASTCWIAARGDSRPDDVDEAIARLDITRLRDAPVELRAQIDRLVRRAIKRRV